MRVRKRVTWWWWWEICIVCNIEILSGLTMLGKSEVGHENVTKNDSVSNSLEAIGEDGVEN